MTYEKVLAVFAAYLAEDDTYDVVLSKHGYTVLNGEANCRELYGALLCRTPEELRDTLLDAYREYRSFQMVSDNLERRLTKVEKDMIEAECQNLLDNCQ